MQLTLRRKQRLIDTFFVAINVYAALFSIAAISTAIVSPWIATVTGDWSGVLPAVAIGVLGAWLARLEWAILGEMVRDALVRRRIRRDARAAAATHLAEALTSRPEPRSLVRVLEPVWTPFGMLQPHHVGVVCSLDLDDDLVAVRWPLGENVMDFHHLAAE